MFRGVLAAAAAFVAFAAPASAATYTVDTTAIVSDDPFSHLAFSFSGDFAPQSLDVGDVLDLTVTFDRALEFHQGYEVNFGASLLPTVGGAATTASTFYELLGNIGSLTKSTGQVNSVGGIFFNVQMAKGPLEPGSTLTGFRMVSTLVSGAPQTITRLYGSFNEVPEPATWALMIAGFGLVGAAARVKAPADRRASLSPQRSQA